MPYDTLAQDDSDAHSDRHVVQPASETCRSPSDYTPASPSIDRPFRSRRVDSDDPIITRSREGSIPMRYPIPDTNSLQGASGSVERLESSAERLSLSSDVEEAIQKMMLDQRRQSGSRRSSQAGSPLDRDHFASPVHRQVSYGHGTHHSSSIVGTNSVARNGGLSSSAYLPSTHNSIHSGSWSHHNSVKSRPTSSGQRLTQIAEPALEGRPLDSPLQPRTSSIPLSPPVSPRDQFNSHRENSRLLDDIQIPHTNSPELGEDLPRQSVEEPRPSTDTREQRNTLFSDFDGTHLEAHSPPHSVTPEMPSTYVTPMSRRASQMLQDVPPQGMSYYPAPVPINLRLPEKLSKRKPAATLEKRRTELFGDSNAHIRKSTVSVSPHLAGDDTFVGDDIGEPQTMESLPPQLRASMFFDHPSSRQNIEIQNGSAVETLDRILDASAYAPVTAFTDHPIVGKLGNEVYGRQKRRITTDPINGRNRDSSASHLMRQSSVGIPNAGRSRRSSLLSWGNFGKRKSSAHADGYLQQHQGSTGALSNERLAMGREEYNAHRHNGEYDEDDGDDDGATFDANEENAGFEGKPTTLLGELQMRKRALKERTRAAATAFPNGMHSTLLELEAVAQVQSQARRKKHTLLAWEDPRSGHIEADDDDDEDVPLGVLQQRHEFKSRRFDQHRPLGLLEMRDLEDNEPLSHRRARLRGEPIPRTSTFGDRSASPAAKKAHAAPAVVESDDDDDEYANETLRERQKRLKATIIPTQPDAVSGDFASEMLSQLGGVPLTATAQGQQALPNPRRYGSRAAIPPHPAEESDEEETLAQRRRRLQALRAAGQSLPVTAAPSGPVDNPAIGQRRSMADILQYHPAAGAGMRRVSNDVAYAPALQSRNTAWATRVNQQAASNMGPYARGAVAGGGVAVPGTGTGNDARQKDMIDRWRQSIVQ